jgi:phosphoglycolate phosphatase-like HAD superfamily hydrolase
MMKLSKKKILACALAASMSWGFAYHADAATRSEIAAIHVEKAKDFKYWSDNAPAKKQLIEYVQDVTNKKSPNYIPVEDRIAVFDCDGTLMCETAPFYFDWMLCLHRMQNDPTYTPSAEEKKLAQEFATAIANHKVTDEMDELKNNKIFPKIFAGMTPEAYQAYVDKYMKSSNVQGLTNLKTGEAFYLPMAEVVSYLDKHNFTVYVVSGCERDTVRTLVKDIMPIQPNHVIGSDHSYRMEKQPENVRADFYQYTPGDKLVRGDKLVGINVKSNKVVLIHREIGKKPVLAFGNSSGDASMFDYTITDNKYKAAAFTLLCDDTERELGNKAKADKMKASAQKHGWTSISMKDDFKTIYGDNVKRSK